MKDLALIEDNLSYYSGEGFWRTAILPKLEERTESDRKVMERVKRLFQVANKCREVVIRQRNALYGNNPTWRIVNQLGEGDDSAGAKTMAEILRRLQKRWLQMSIGRYEHHTDPIAKALDDMYTTGYGYLRIWSPARFVNHKNPVYRVGLHSPSSSAVDIVSDDDGLPIKALYFFTKDEISLVEVQEIDEQGMTVFHWENEGGKLVPMDNDGTEYLKLDLGGRFSVFEMRRDALLSDTIKRAQNAINHALTMVPTNIEYAGFLLQIVTNGLPPGEYRDVDGKQVFMPKEELVFSPGRTNYVAGIPQFDNTGNVTGYTNPGVTTHDPVDISPLIDAYKLFCSVIYENVNQGHILSQEMILSGISRQQLRGDFKSSLTSDKELVESILSDVYMAALLMVGGASFSSYDVMVSLMIDMGAPSPEERKDIRDNYAAGLLSRKTAITLQGYVDSAEAEMTNLEQEVQTSIEVGEAAADIIDLPNRNQPEESAA